MPSPEVYLRVGQHDGKVYLDLANEAREIDSQGWRILTTSPINFRQPAGMLPLPRPVRGGSLSEMERFINADSDSNDLLLIQAWAIGCLHPNGPYPILGLHGERGSAKTTITRFLCSLIDPAKAPLRKEPKDDQALAIMAHNNHVLALDNLSRLPIWLSDALCRIATRAGDAYRTLYTNDEESIFEACRPIIINGIEEIATRGDLLDRSIIIMLGEIDETSRMSETDYWRAADEARPRILGALLDAVSTAIRDLPTLHYQNLPRMADFALWVSAAESAIPVKKPGAFLQAYMRSRDDANGIELEASPVATAMMKFMEEKAAWEGSATDLLNSLKEQVDVETLHFPSWPKNGRALGGHLKRLAPSFRAIGWNIKPDRKGRGRSILITRGVTQSNANAQKSDANTHLLMITQDQGNEAGINGGQKLRHFASLPDEAE